jgi:hypothetical protein
MPCAVVAAVNLFGICEVEAGDSWEFFCCGGQAGEDGGAAADFDFENLE